MSGVEGLTAQALAQKEEALRMQQEFARLVLDSTSEGFFALDGTGSVTLCNAAFLTMLGYASANEVLGKKIQPDLRPSPTDDAKNRQAVSPIQQAAAQGQPVRAQGVNFYGQDGTHFPVDYAVKPVWRRGVLDGAICTFSDATERLLSYHIRQARKKAESNLREIHDQLRLAEAAGGIGSFLLDVKTDNIVASGEFFRLFGLPAATPLRARAMEALFLPDGPSVGSTQASRQSGDALLNVEYRIKKADTGEIRWIARQAEFVRDESGAPVWMRGVVQDVTERKLAEATRQESETRFRMLAQAVPNQVWSATREGQLDWVNQKVFDYSGLSETQLLGDNWAQLVHPDDQERVAEEWRNALEQ